MLVTRKDAELIGTSEVFRVTHNCNPITWEVEAGELLSLAFFWSQPGIHSESLFRKENLREIQSQFYFRLPPKISSDYQILLPRNIDSHHRLGDWLAPSSLALTPSLALPQWPLCICTLRSPDTTPLPSQTKPKEPHSSTTRIFVIVRQLRKAKSALASIWGHGLTHAHCLFAIE